MRTIAAFLFFVVVLQAVCWKVDSPIYLVYGARANLIVSCTIFLGGVFVGMVAMSGRWHHVR